MNILLLANDDHDQDGLITITDRRFIHVRDILKAKPGDTIKIAYIRGATGLATITAMGSNAMQLVAQSPVAENLTTHNAVTEKTVTQKPPCLPLSLLIALPRPQMLKRILQTIATFGVRELHLIQTQRVEKSYWQSPRLQEKNIEEELKLGTEQGAHSWLPHVFMHRNWHTFIDEQLPLLSAGKTKLIAHPEPNAVRCQQARSEQNFILAVGPEGGFINSEVDVFLNLGFQQVTLGDKILRVETAVTALLAKLFL